MFNRKNKKNQSNESKKKNASGSGSGSNGSILSSTANLYDEQSKFVDKKTLLEYIDSVQQSNNKIFQDLKRCYEEKFKPFEENFHYTEYFDQNPIEDAFWTSKPMILLIGQYSSGKSTFVKYLIDKDYPGIRIGPEPTTDKFVAVMYGKEPAIIPGNALVMDKRKQFGPLLKFGNKFLNRFQSAEVDSMVLKGLTIIDTPGVLSDSNNSSGFDYKAVIEWFAQQADRIFLFVDAHKLELSGDFQKIIEMIRCYDDKLRIVLNKTDLVSEQEMIRIYGALMWFLGQSLEMKEVIQIFVGSFWSKPLPEDARRKLYEYEEFRIYEDLSNLPQESLLRKVNFLAKRCQQVTMHACIISTFKDYIRRASILRFIFEQQLKQIYFKKLTKICKNLEKQYEINDGLDDGSNSNDPDSSPNLEKMKLALIKINLNKTKTFNKKLFQAKDEFIEKDLPEIIDRIHNEKFPKIFKIKITGESGVAINESPFDFAKGEGFDEGSLEKPGEWIVEKYRSNYQPIFNELKCGGNKVSATKAKAQMLKSNLPSKILNKIWTMADIDRDGMLDRDEFALAMYLISVTLQNYDLPEQLPRHLIPPNKRR